MLDRLEGPDRPTELHPLEAVGDGVVEGALHAADLQGGGQHECDVADVVGERIDALLDASASWVVGSIADTRRSQTRRPG